MNMRCSGNRAEEVEIDAHGRTLRTISRERATPGDVLSLTIDIDLQVAREALGNHRGAVVAMEPNTGEVLVMASSPSFDPTYSSMARSENLLSALVGPKG